MADQRAAPVVPNLAARRSVDQSVGSQALTVRDCAEVRWQLPTGGSISSASVAAAATGRWGGVSSERDQAFGASISTYRRSQSAAAAAPWRARRGAATEQPALTIPQLRGILLLYKSPKRDRTHR
eukprot:SAG31_NODE_8317_length_1475_cov_1.488372_2_plen_125_part_00